MKKIIYLLALYFSFITLAHPESVSIFTNRPQNQMKISYQICALNKDTTVSPCDPIKQTSIKGGDKKISVPNDAFYVRIWDALELSPDGEQIAYNTFPGSEDCKGFVYVPVALHDNEDKEVLCNLLA